ncbi:MAG: hypothetical protein R3E72_06480 [Steroidobacteraceae bacterium]
MTTTRRGRVLRDTSVGAGLIFVDGKQYPFNLEGSWKSEYAPKVNMGVDADFDDQGNLIAVRAVGAQMIAGEQAAQVLGLAQDKAKKLAAEFQDKGAPVIAQYAGKIGYSTLGAFAAVVIGWFFLPLVSVNLGMIGKNSVTFYQGLKLLNASGIESLAALSGGGSAGLYGVLCFAALATVFLPQLWRDSKAGFGMTAPLLLMLLVGVVAYFKISGQISAGQEQAGAFGGAEYQQMAREMAERASAEMRKAISIGFGLWLSLAGAIYLGWQGWGKSRLKDRVSRSPSVSMCLLAALAVMANANAAEKLPAPVAKAMRDIAAVCSDVGGKPQMKDALQRADLNADGLMDYVVNVAGVNCEGAVSVYGDREKGVMVFTADAKAGAHEAFNDSVYGVRLERSQSSARLWLTVSGEGCGKKPAANFASEAFCERPLVWNAKTGKFAYAPVSMIRMIE